MNARGLLDADMHTLGRWLAQGWRWWAEELRALVPSALRGGVRDALPRLAYREGRLVSLVSGKAGAPVASRRGLRAAIVVPPELCLLRIVERPAMNARDLQRMLELEGDILLPFAAGATVIAGRSKVPAMAPGRCMIEIVGMPIDTAREIAAAAEAMGIVAVRVLCSHSDGEAPIDFTPAMRTAGLLPQARSATPCAWVLVGFLVALNLAALIWRDTASVTRLEQTVQAQQPAVSVAQTITRRAEADRQLVARTLAARRAHDAVGGLAAVSGSLPDGAWLQRYQWDGPGVRLTGYKPARTDVATALRRSGRFAEVRSLADEVQAAVPAGEPFDLSARIAR